MNPVVLINPFEVPPGQEEEALAFWERVAEYLRRQPGFVSTRLHRAISPQARFTDVNVAEWESAEHFLAAINWTCPGSMALSHFAWIMPRGGCGAGADRS